MRLYITICAALADKLIAMAEREKRSVNSQASWLLERLLEGAITAREEACYTPEAAHGE